MIIQAHESDAYLQFERTDTEDYYQVTVTASVDGIVASTGTWFPSSEQFLAELTEFERTRQCMATLSADPPFSGFSLVIQPCGSTGAAWLSFRLCHSSYYSSSKAPQDYRKSTITVESSFVVHGEFIGELLQQFKEFLPSERNL